MDNLRVGLGYDLHRLEFGRPLVLANVPIPHNKGPVGHSDADVVIHALIDAITGAAGMPDVGELFPNTDPEIKDINSARLIEKVIQHLNASPWRIVNVDIVVMAQQPRLSPHKLLMRARLSELLTVPMDRINIKAKTNEHVDAVGQELAIACHCVVLLARKS